ncbi:MAG: hypothetical protein WCL16_06915 [bacterium]
MAEIPKTVNASDDESRAWEGIHLFERIVEAFPHDRAALDSLTQAYEQVGEWTLAVKHLVRLAEATMADGDDAALAILAPRLKRLAESDTAARAASERITAFLANNTSQDAAGTVLVEDRGTGDMSGGNAMRRTAAVTAELSLAWTLHQAGELNAEDYAKVANDLTELSSADKQLTVSVLHVLRDRGGRSLDRILAYMAKEKGAPVISLAGFELREDIVGLLTMEYMLRNGVLVFDLMGRSDALVVIMNPYRQPLRDDLCHQLARHVHFYMTPPTEFDAALDRILKRRSEKAASAAPAPTPAAPV